MKAKEFEIIMDEIAPLRYSYEWDNSGMTILTHDKVEKVLVSLDVTEEVVAEAVERGCDTILSHHPLIFKGIKGLKIGAPVENCCIKAVQAGLNLYAAHTSYDCAPMGINYGLAKALDLRDTALLCQEGADALYKVVVFAPRSGSDAVRQAMFQAGAGAMGNYQEASYETQGHGRFTPLKGASPAIGQVGRPEAVEETRIEVLCGQANLEQVVQAAKAAHAYEEPAVDAYQLALPKKPFGIGMIGNLGKEMEPEAFAAYVKKRLDAAAVNLGGCLQKVRRVACVGGAGGEFFSLAKKLGADALVVGEAKYNHFLDAKASGILMAEAGHYDTEKTFVPTMIEGLQNASNRVQYNIVAFASKSGFRPYAVY